MWLRLSEYAHSPDRQANGALIPRSWAVWPKSAHKTRATAPKSPFRTRKTPPLRLFAASDALARSNAALPAGSICVCVFNIKATL